MQDTIAQAAAELARSLRPRTVLIASGSDLLARELRDQGIDVTTFSPRLAGRYDLVVWTEDFDLGAVPQISSVAEKVLFPLPATPLMTWLESFARSGFMPDPGYQAQAMVLLEKGPAWPPEALRLFADSIGLRETAKRVAELEEELAAERRLTSTLRGIQSRLSNDARDLRDKIEGTLEEARSRSPERRNQDADADAEIQAQLARMERRITELNRGLQALNGRIEGILTSRTWKILTAAGGIVLRLTGRKS